MNYSDYPQDYSPDIEVVESRSSVKVQKILWFVLGILETLLALRIFLRVIAANPGAGFTQFIYNITHPFLIPFMNLVRAPASEGAVLEISSMIAMIVYALLFVFVINGIRLFTGQLRRFY